MFGGMQPKLETQGRKLEVFERHIDKHCRLSIWMFHAAAEGKQYSASALYLAIYFNLSVICLHFFCLSDSVHPPLPFLNTCTITTPSSL